MKYHEGFASGVLAVAALLFATTARADDVYVTRSNNTIDIIDTVTKAESTWVSTGLDNPTGLAFDSSGNLFVVNKGDDSIVKISPGGTVTTFVSGSHGSALLNDPQGLVVDSSGNVYVANLGSTGNNTNSIIKFNSSGAGSVFATSATLLNTPVGLAIDGNNNIYVATGLNEITKFTTTPTVTGSVFANAVAGTTNLNGLAFDKNGNLYVTSTYNNSDPNHHIPNAITVYNTLGVGTIIASNDGQVPNPPAGSTSYLFNPLGVAVDSAGNVYAANNSPSTSFGNNDTLYYSAANGPANLILGGSPDNQPNFMAIGPAAVPEPSSLVETSLLLMMGGSIFGWWRRAAVHATA